MEIKEFLIKAIKIGIALVFFTPLVLGPFGLNMSEYPKMVFFRCIIETIFVFYIFLILLNPAHIPKRSLLLFSIIVFDAVLIIASIAGINFYRSFFGEMQRGEGIILHLHLLAFFIILIGLFKKREDWLWLFKTTVIISGLSSIAAILQQLKVWSFYNVEPIRLSGTFSNPDFFGSYVTLSIFLAIFLLISEKERNQKILWLFFIILNFYTLIFSQTRGAWLGFIFGVVSVYLLNYKNLNYKKRIYSLIIVLSISVFALFLPQMIQKFHLQDNYLSKRVLTIYNLEITGRSDIWGTSLGALKDRPYLGWGFDSFSFVYDKYLKKGYVAGTYFDRPHNKLIEILVYSGAIGAISYFFIFFVLFYLILKYAKKWDGYNGKQGMLFGSIIFAFFVSGFVQNIFGFDHIGIYISFFLVAGFVNNNFSDLPIVNLKEFDKPIRPNGYPEKVIFIGSLVVFMGFVMYQINIKPTTAAMYFPGNIRYEASNPAIALNGYKNGTEMNTVYDNDLVITFADRLVFLLENTYGRGIGDQATKDLLEIKPFLYESLAKKDMRPNNMYELLSRSDEWAYIVKKDPSYLDDMENDLNQAISFNPNIPVFYQLRGEMKILQDKNKDGETDINKSCKMDSVGCDKNEAELYKMIGIAYFKKGDLASAIKNFQNALDMNYNSKKNNLPYVISGGGQFTDSVAVMYYSYFKNFESCKKVYEKGMEVYPEYKNIFQQHLDVITADYEKNKQ